jgi:hypothetical protein
VAPRSRNSPSRSSAVAPDASSTRSPGVDAGLSEVSRLLHGLNNQLGVILANAELLEHRLGDDANRVRASLVVSGTLEAITTAQRLRHVLASGGPDA